MFIRMKKENHFVREKLLRLDGIDQRFDAFALLLGKPAKTTDDLRFMLVQCTFFDNFDLSAQLGMSDNIVDRGIKVVCHAFQRFDVGFDVVVFVFVDRGLAQVYGFCQLLLAYPGFCAKKFKIFQHIIHLMTIVTVKENKR